MKSLLAKLGLWFLDPEDERRFADEYLLSKIWQSQLFLIIAGMFVYSFFVWDRIIDPVNWNQSHILRGLVMTPVMIGCAAILYTQWGRKWFEAIVMVALFNCMVGLAAVYAILDKGYDYAALGFFMALMGVASMFPVRAIWLIPASVFAVVVVMGGHYLADNSTPGWWIVNLMAVIGGISFGILSSSIREKGAREQFQTQKELTVSRARVDDLLHSMLPSEIVSRIQKGETAIAESHGEVSIIFADLVGFTEMSRRISPSHLLKVLNRIFSSFDLEAEKRGIDRIKTIGDAYMAIGGLQRVPGRDHAENAADFAIALVASVKQIVAEMGYPINIRIGLHVGPVVAGVIGVRRPAFDCWGEAVNLANRLETAAAPGSIVVSESAYWRLRPFFDMEPLGETELKGIGPVKTFELVAKRDVPLADFQNQPRGITGLRLQ
jgi:adenylate cyclase